MKKEHRQRMVAIAREFEASVKADRKREVALQKLAEDSCPFQRGDTVEWIGGYPRQPQRGVVARICRGSPGFKEVGNKPYLWTLSVRRYLRGSRTQFTQERTRLDADQAEAMELRKTT